MIFVSVAAKLNSPERTQDLRKLLDKMRATGDLCPLSPLNGSPTWTRTRDLRINSPSLYQLSYQGIVRYCSRTRLTVSKTLSGYIENYSTFAMASTTRSIFLELSAATQIRPVSTA